MFGEILNDDQERAMKEWHVEKEKRNLERKETTKNANVMGELFNYFSNKHMWRVKVDRQLDEIIANINLEEKLAHDEKLQAIIEDIKKLENGVNIDKMALFSELLIYHQSTIFKIY